MPIGQDSQERNDETRTHFALIQNMMVSQYRIVEKIGAGGMGEVYLAEDTVLKRHVALKFLSQHVCHDQDCRARFMREAEATAQLNHPNIITIHEVGQFKGHPYLSMEHVEGKSLRILIKEQRLTLDGAIDLTIQMCEGLTKAHEAGITHRDIKPSNILIDKDGHLKLLDFGLATIRGSEPLTKTGSTVGTVGYMSPEQVQGKTTDSRSDIFSLATVTYEMITGRPAFRASNDAATINAILNDTPEPLSQYGAGVPHGLQAILDKALIKDVEARYQTVADMLTDLKKLKAGEVAVKPAGRSSAHLWRTALPGAVLLGVLLILIIKPWRVDISSTREAVAAEDRMAIMYFDNLVEPQDEARTAQMITSLLITDLSESRYLHVVSQQRLYDVLKRIGRENMKAVDRTVASDVAREVKAKWMLTGDVLQLEPNIELKADVSECATGEVLFTQRISGEIGEDLFSVIDKLSAEIKRDLSLPTDAADELDQPIADVTTNSPEAYRYYLEGKEDYARFYFSDARRSFLKALEYDSTFAMVYYMLAGGQLETDRRLMLAKAVEYSEGATRKEKHLIRSRQAELEGDDHLALEEYRKIIDIDPEDMETYVKLGLMYQLNIGDIPKAIEYYRKALEIDPSYKEPYNNLAYAYNRIGEFDKAILAIDKYISLAPDEANPYDSRGEIYALNGRLDEAIESFQIALQIKPDQFPKAKLGHMYLFKRDYAKAEQCYRMDAAYSSEVDRSRGRLLLSYIPAHQGKFDEALEVLDDAISADELEDFRGVPYMEKFFLKAWLHLEKGNLDKTAELTRKSLDLYNEMKSFPFVADREICTYMLAASGHVPEAEAVAEQLRKDFHKEGSGAVYAYWEAIGAIELVRGNADSAMVLLEEAAKHSDEQSFHLDVFLAMAYLDAGRLGAAVQVLEKALQTYGFNMAYHAPLAVRARYLLGQAYEGSNWPEQAIQQYEEFLDIWKDADPGIEAIDDARVRLARLRGTRL